MLRRYSTVVSHTDKWAIIDVTCIIKSPIEYIHNYNLIKFITQINFVAVYASDGNSRIYASRR